MDDSLLFIRGVVEFVVVITVSVNLTGFLDEIIFGVAEPVADRVIPAFPASLTHQMTHCPLAEVSMNRTFDIDIVPRRFNVRSGIIIFVIMDQICLVKEILAGEGFTRHWIIVWQMMSLL